MRRCESFEQLFDPVIEVVDDVGFEASICWSLAGCTIDRRHGMQNKVPGAKFIELEYQVSGLVSGDRQASAVPFPIARDSFQRQPS